jgi:hypothetical protein
MRCHFSSGPYLFESVVSSPGLTSIPCDISISYGTARHLLLAVPAISVELFRYRRAAKNGGTLEYVFGLVNKTLPTPKEKAAEIAADFMTTFYHVRVGELETQEFRTAPLPHWLICFWDTTKGPLRQMYFVVLLQDGTVVL